MKKFSGERGRVIKVFRGHKGVKGSKIKLNKNQPKIFVYKVEIRLIV